MDGIVLVNQLTFENGGSAITVVDSATNQVLGTAIIRVPEDLDSRSARWSHGTVRCGRTTGTSSFGSTHRQGSYCRNPCICMKPSRRGCSSSMTEVSGSSATTEARGAGPRRLSLFDPETREVQTFVDVPGIAPNAMAVGPRSVWVLDYHGTLTRIDLP